MYLCCKKEKEIYILWNVVTLTAENMCQKQGKSVKTNAIGTSFLPYKTVSVWERKSWSLNCTDIILLELFL